MSDEQVISSGLIGQSGATIVGGTAAVPSVAPASVIDWTIRTSAVRRFYRVLTATILLSFFVISLGGTVRVHNAGLSCPDWPYCHNQLVPKFDFQIFLEWFHRLAAGAVSCCALVLGVMIIRGRDLRALFGRPIVAALALLTLQVVLGGLTVLRLLEPRVVAAHLVNAVLFFSVLLWMWMIGRGYLFKSRFEFIGSAGRRNASRLVRSGFVVFAVLTLAQILIGGMVSSNHAGLACADFPTCNGSWGPDPVSFHTILQMVHRYVAFAVAALAAVLWFVARPRRRARLTVQLAGTFGARWMKIVPLLVAVQFSLGMANVWFLLPNWVSVAHLANAVLIYWMSALAALEAMGVDTKYGHRISSGNILDGLRPRGPGLRLDQRSNELGISGFSRDARSY